MPFPGQAKTQFTMKNRIFFASFFILAGLYAVSAQNKGYITVMQSETAVPAMYDGAIAKLKEAGVWELGWTFHAIGAMQPAGLYSFGIFPDKASLDARSAKNMEVYKANNINTPPLQVYPVYNQQMEPIPAVILPGAVLIHFKPGAMSAAQYDKILEGLAAAGQQDNPSRLFHVAFSASEGHLEVIDIWESAEKFEAFGQVLIPILQGIFDELPTPEVYGLHNLFLK